MRTRSMRLMSYYGKVKKLYNENMKREEILSLLKENQPKLDAFGVRSLSLFGSVARNEATSESDIDILVQFNGKVTFDRFMDTRFFLEDLLGAKVDVVMQDAIRPSMKPYIMKDLIHAA